MESSVVLGGSGFIGSACVAALKSAGWDTRAEPAPRLATNARSMPELMSELQRNQVMINKMADVLSSTDVVVNAGGIPAHNAEDSDALFGANSLLPGVISAAARQAGARRFIHLSSIAVQGRMDPLDETMQHHVYSPYSHSRSLGERIITGPDDDHAVILRLPSVHDIARTGTWKLWRTARSPFSSTAGRGDRPTPLVLIQNVGAAVEFLAVCEGDLPKVVIQPTEGLTTGRILELLGDRHPRRIPMSLAKPVTHLLLFVGRRSPRVHTLGRGLELMWLGQAQRPSWLTEAGFVPPVGAEGWTAIGRALSCASSPPEQKLPWRQTA